MIREFALSYSNRFVSRWLVLIIDMMIVVTSFFFAVLLRFNFDLERIPVYKLDEQVYMILIVYSLGELIFKSYSGVIRHTSITDAIRVVKAMLFSFFVMMVLTFINRSYINVEEITFSYSIVIIHSLIAIMMLLSLRMMFKLAYFRIISSRTKKDNTLIYGAGDLGIITKNTLLSTKSSNVKIISFIDENPTKVGKFIEGIKVVSKEVLTKEYLKSNDIKVVVIAMQNIAPAKKDELVDLCLEMGVKVKNVPAVSDWINGELKVSQIKDVKIEDLLERELISLKKDNIKEDVNGKVILVTGAAGSIGSEISTQLLRYSPKKIIFLDLAESPLYDLQNELKGLGNAISQEFIVGDISDYYQMRKVFLANTPDIVYHAAAYKHVPLVEDNPYVGVKVNIHGVKIISDLSVEFGVKKFVMVSTDKAVNPTNVMGATKRVAEIYIQALNGVQDKTNFITTRFGNVLGSNGSVIPLFRKQIMKGGPLLVTHKDITRYFMTIPEACQLVLEAGAMGNGGEIYVFDMGTPVKILDVAKKMIMLSGLEEGKDIDIEISGLRPGEKLYEELLNNKENTKPTHHNKIMIGMVRAYDQEVVKTHVDKIILAMEGGDDFRLVGEIKALVPEFLSNNSIFASLDQK